ncbi:hypothetical protein HDU87_005782 [Geranomyces variabilis]|uniref:Uncharacterized protein n=1 Tax=Geranomyces variabilis TaxID=109894 RepID=A0AAD5TGP1_9FUNG|nr:hypothetical protein HDU87_005782 [Geranomyces variabilis]
MSPALATPSVSTTTTKQPQPPPPEQPPPTDPNADQPAAAPTSLISAHIAHLASPNILISTRLPQIRWEKTAAHTLSQKLLLAHRVADAEKLLTQLAARQLALAQERAQLDARIAGARDRRRGVEIVLRDLLVLHRDVVAAAAAANANANANAPARERGDVPGSSSSLASLAGNANAGLGMLRPGGGGNAGGGGISGLSPRPPLPFAASVLALHKLAPHRPAGPNAPPQHPVAQAFRRASMGGGALGVGLQQQHQRLSPLAVAEAASDDGESDQEDDDKAKTHDSSNVHIKNDIPPVLVVPPPPPPACALTIPTLVVPEIQTTAASDNDNDGPSAFAFVVEEAL